MTDFERFILILQKVNDTYPFGTGASYILAINPSPSDLDDDDALDYEEKTGITNTSEALQIDKTFTFADLSAIDYSLRKYVRCVALVGIARTGSTDGNVYFTKATFDLGYVDSNGNFTSLGSANATPNFSTNSTSYQLCSAQAWITLTDNLIKKNHRLALRVRLYGYIATTESGKMRLYFGRGSADSYIELIAKARY